MIRATLLLTCGIIDCASEKAKKASRVVATASVNGGVRRAPIQHLAAFE
jgi:hypothetical protein